MVCPDSVSFHSAQLQETRRNLQQREDVRIAVLPDQLQFHTETGRSRSLAFLEIQDLQVGSYCLEIRTSDQAEFIISRLGYDFEAFIYQVFSAWNQFAGKALFIDEICLLETKGDYAYRNPADNPAATGFAETDDRGATRFRLYDSSLLVLPQGAPIRRMPLCMIDSVRRTDWQLMIEAPDGESLTVRRLGHDMDAFDLVLRQALQKQTDRALNLLRQILQDHGLFDPSWPALTGQGLNAAAWLLREGRAADAVTLESVCPGLYQRLDAVLRQWSTAGYYAELAGLSQAAGVGLPVVGIRREQPTDALNEDSDDDEALSADKPEQSAESARSPNAADQEADDQPAVPSFWVAAPLLADGRAAVAVELVSRQPLPQATYVFSRPQNPAAWTSCRHDLNRGLEAVDFRREAVFLTAGQLELPAYRRERAALRFCPAYLRLRQQYLGRVIHRGLPGWRDRLVKTVMKGV